MGEWPEYIIKDIALTMADAPFGSNLKTKDYQSDGVLVIQGKNIQGRNCKWDDVRYVSREKFDSLKRHHAILGALVFPKVGTIGKVGYLTHPKDEKYFLLSTNTMMLEVDPDIALTDFVFYYFLSPHVQRNIQNMSSSSVQPVFNFTSLKHYPIFLPPLPEQKAIASVLSSLDDKIDLLHRQNKTLEAMAETLFRQWFSGADYSSSIASLIELQNGYAFKGRDFQESGENRVLKIKNISGGVVDISSTDFISGSVSDSIDGKFSIVEGDVLFAMTGAKIGKMGIIPRPESPLWLNQRVGLFKERYKGSRFLAYLHLDSEYGKDYIENTATGSAQPNISGTDIENCEFPSVSEELIITYSEQLATLYGKVIFNLNQIHTLEKMRDTLLPKLMSGEIHVEAGH